MQFITLVTLGLMACVFADVSHLSGSHGYNYDRPQHNLNIPVHGQYYQGHVEGVSQGQADIHQISAAGRGYLPPAPAPVVEQHTASFVSGGEQPAGPSREYLPPVHSAPVTTEYQAPVQHVQQQHVSNEVHVQGHSAPAITEYQAPVQHVQQQHVSNEVHVQHGHSAPATIEYQAPVQHVQQQVSQVQHGHSAHSNYEYPAPVQHVQQQHVSNEVHVQQGHSAPSTIEYQAPVQHVQQQHVSNEVHVQQGRSAPATIQYQAPVQHVQHQHVSHEVHVQQGHSAPSTIQYQAPVQHVQQQHVSNEVHVQHGHSAPATIEYQAPVQHVQQQHVAQVVENVQQDIVPVPAPIYEAPSAGHREYLPPVQQQVTVSGGVSHTEQAHGLDSYSASPIETGGYHYNTPAKRFRF